MAVEIAGKPIQILLKNATGTGAGTAYQIAQAETRGKATLQASGLTTSGAGAAEIAVQVSNDNVNWLTLGTISLTLSTTESSDGFAFDAPWAFVRGNVTSISGTGAAVSLLMGV